jgi:prophage regulatory protein
MATSKLETNNQQFNFALGYLRIWQIVGDRKRGIEPLLPIGRSTFLAGVKSGKYPKPVKLGERTTAWRKADILVLLENLEGAA